MERPVRKASALRLVGCLALFAGASVALAGCEQPGAAAPDAPTGSAPPTASAAPTASATPVPAAEVADTDPEAFDLTETTYWDGRPSLGGVWVAHPLVDQPMRVRITNADTGESVDGALFRRDAALSGPSILLSYDAAKAIGVDPGVVTQIRIVALKDAEILKAEKAAAAEAPEAAEAPDSAMASAPEAGAAPSVETTTIAPAAAAQTAPAVAEAPVAQAPAATSEAPAPAAPEATKAAAKTTPATEPVAPEIAAPQRAAPAKIITAGEAAGAGKPFADAVAPAPSDDAPKAAEPAPGLKNRFIQIATFKLAVNAEKSADLFRQIGIPVEVRQGLAAGEQRMSRVLLGPFSQQAEQAEAMRTARARGYRDAYYVDN